MNGIQEPRPVPEYWDIIKVDGASFLTAHPCYESALYSGALSPSPIRDLRRATRSIIGGSARLLRSFVQTGAEPIASTATRRQSYAILVNAGGPKYAKEEKEVQEACERHGLRVRLIRADLSCSEPPASAVEVLSPSSSLPRGDNARILAAWLWACARGVGSCIGGDAKKRSLFIATIPALRRSLIYASVLRRAVEKHGRPVFVLTLAPWTAVSIAVVAEAKRQRVLTAGLRTQTTFEETEHLVFDTDLLFCKSTMETRAYEKVFGNQGPRLVPGCILSTPADYLLPPLELPESYVLLVGTDPPANQSEDERKRYPRRLKEIASLTGLPAVYKKHPAAAGDMRHDEPWLDEDGALCLTDTRRNKELIDRATLVVSAPSTMLYHAILKEKPVIIVESLPFHTLPDEFVSAPIQRIAWDGEVDGNTVAWRTLDESATAAKTWLQREYHLDKGTDWMIELLRTTRNE